MLLTADHKEILEHMIYLAKKEKSNDGEGLNRFFVFKNYEGREMEIRLAFEDMYAGGNGVVVPVTALFEDWSFHTYVRNKAEFCVLISFLDNARMRES